MRRRKALIATLSVVAVCGLTLALTLLSEPAPAIAYRDYTYKPGCHCGAPKTTTTTQKPATTTTTQKPATTTTRPAPRPATTTTVKAPTTTVTTQSPTTSTVVALPSTSTVTALDPATSPDHEAGVWETLAAAGLFGAGGEPPADSGTGDGSEGVSADDAAVTVDGLPLSMTAEAPRYNVSPVAIVFLMIYGASFLLYRTRRMRVTTHRKIWNGLLLATFLITGMFGLILAIGISQNPPWLLPSSLLFWHVETGIVMCLISFFHLGWHARYYAKMLIPQRASRRERSSADRGADLLGTGRSQPAFDWSAEIQRARRMDRYGTRSR